MAKQKARYQKKKQAKPRKDDNLKIHLKRAFTGIVLLIILVVAAGVIAHHLLARKQSVQPSGIPPTVWPPKFEIYPEEEKEEIPPPKPAEKPWPPPPEKLPKVAIIIDDIGFDGDIAEKFLQLDANLTFSLLPYTRFQKRFAKKVSQKGLEVMLHLPMEPNEFPRVDPGPGALLTSMSPDELINQLKKNLDAVPGIKGVNNHMGSKMTTVSSQIYQIFTVLKQQGLFFIDSRTTLDSVCRPSARLFQIPFAQRDVFIDHNLDPDLIRRQIDRLVQIANIHGEAVGIAHPHMETYHVLSDMLPDLQKKVRLVPASEIVHPVS
ncbi:MAG: divergent polysaccharide deacetylase family protein [Desulfobacterales bacterium]|uniref:Divergent polysaccharide deacetylase family protein n=1 Tax=Candidatus Desulfatibia profunda TaxID=2841695 RepID=A0A8J6TGU4_9BACT|nr:divergent polysaccharide deacetylase family protein [Candidatus Desulfatibia profunda]MBL7180095.1 divergent polysaccharide deacetylase family protein [Desulfobacterales bacterium]